MVSHLLKTKKKKFDKIILEKPPLYLPGAVVLDPGYPIESLWEFLKNTMP